jgi:hypothetical protein
MKKKLILLFILTIIIVPSVMATPESWTDDIPITFNGTAQVPSIVLDSNSNSHIVYTDQREGPAEIYYQKINTTGNPPVNEKRLTFDYGQSLNPEIGIDSNENLHVLWLDDRNMGYGHNEIYYQKLNNNGGLLSQNKRITFATTNTIRQLSFGIDSSDNIQLFWEQTGNYGIYYQKLNNNGDTIIPTTLIESNSNLGRIDMAIDENDKTHLSFTSSNSEIFYMKLDDIGHVTINKTLIVSNPSQSRDQRLTVDNFNNLHIIWKGRPGSGDFDIFYKKLDNDGNNLTSDLRLDEGGSVYTDDPDITSDSIGNIYVTYNDDRPGGLPKQIYYKKLDNNGTSLINDTRLSFNVSGRSSRIVTDESNNVFVVWKGSGNVIYKNNVNNSNDIDTYYFDNADSNFFKIFGRWKNYNYVNSYNGNLRYAQKGIGIGSVGWRVSNTVIPGNYDVYVWKFEHPFQSQTATNAKYSVTDVNGTFGWFEVDQSSPGNEWILVGNYYFDNSSPQGVILNDDADGIVIADAIKLVAV